MQLLGLLVEVGKRVKSSIMLDTIITLPDGSQGTLNDFYNGIMDESIQVTDSGFVLSDGSLIKTNGQPMWNPSAEYLTQLMSAYIGDGKDRVTTTSVGSTDSNEDVDTIGEVFPPKKPFYKKPIGVIAIGVLAYLIYTKVK